jgi:hypothetical protein
MLENGKELKFCKHKAKTWMFKNGKEYLESF